MGAGQDHRVHSALSGFTTRLVSDPEARAFEPRHVYWRKRNCPEHQVNMFRIPRNALIFVGDGRKALFLRNEGDALIPHLKQRKSLKTPIRSHTSRGAIGLDGSSSPQFPGVKAPSNRSIGIISRSTGSRRRLLQPWNRWSA